MSSEVLDGKLRVRLPLRGGLAGVTLIPYILAAGLVWSLIYGAGFWNFIANTRLLDLLIRSGIVMLHDEHQGLIAGMPDLKYYVASQDPVDIGLLLLATGLLLAFLAVKAVQFHGITNICGIPGAFGSHLRAYLYGRGLNRFMPYNLGKVGTASALEGQGVSLDVAALAMTIVDIFVLFEIVVFGLFGIIYLGWTTWLQQIFWGLLILAAAYVFTKRLKRPSKILRDGVWPAVRSALQLLYQHPPELMRLAVLSIVAFGLEIAAIYAITQAFTSENVIINVPVSVVMMGLVAGYIARLIRVTPGGLGQFEWGMAAALYLGGLGIPEAVTAALLVTFMDLYVTGVFVYGAVSLPSNALGYRVNTDLGRVLHLYRTAEPQGTYKPVGAFEEVS